MTNIDPEVQKYFDDCLDLFSHPGWKRFMEDLQSSLEEDQRTTMSRCKTSEELLVERGAQLKTARILSFEIMVRNQYDQLTIEADKNED